MQTIFLTYTTDEVPDIGVIFRQLITYVEKYSKLQVFKVTRSASAWPLKLVQKVMKRVENKRIANKLHTYKQAFIIRYFENSISIDTSEEKYLNPKRLGEKWRSLNDFVMFEDPHNEMWDYCFDSHYTPDSIFLPLLTDSDYREALNSYTLHQNGVHGILLFSRNPHRKATQPIPTFTVPCRLLGENDPQTMLETVDPIFLGSVVMAGVTDIVSRKRKIHDSNDSTSNQRSIITTPSGSKRYLLTMELTEMADDGPKNTSFTICVLPNANLNTTHDLPPERGGDDFLGL